MYTKNNKNGKILNVLLGIIALFIIIFIIAWVVNKGSNSANYDAEFKTNIETLHENAKDYFANELPEDIGDTTLLSLDEVYDLDLSKQLSYGKTACDDTLSYISITKINASEYKVKTNLVCGNKTDSIIEKIATNTIIDDENGNTIIDEDKDNVHLEIEDSINNNNSNNQTGTSSDGKTPNKGNNTVNCFGPICTFKQIETTCNTTYEYEYVKRNVSCPSGYTYLNGTCISKKTETIAPTPNYSDQKLVIEDAKVNKGSSYKRYTDPIVTGGETTYYCDQGELKNGYCYIYTDKQIETTTSCPTGYTKKDNACYKYADLIIEGTSTCPSGYTKNGNACYKYTNPTSSTTTSCPSGYTQSGNACYKYTNPSTSSNTTYTCPSGYTASGSGSNTKCIKTASAVKKYTEWGNPDRTYSTSTKESTYTNELSKKVLVGTNKVGVTTVYTYAIYSRTSYYYCSQGTLSGTTCTITTNATKNTNTTTTCPSGYTKSGSTCYKKTDLITNSTPTCPSGYTLSGDTCYVKTDLIVSENSYCPTGYTREGNSNVCYIKKDPNVNTNHYCPTGYTETTENCYKKNAAKTTTSSKVYSCPEGYNKTGSGANTQCYKTYYSNDTYYCENANATLKGTKCYYYTTPEYLGSSCPNGYTLSGNTCVKTITNSTSPIWSNAEYIYSSATHLDGYQRTGVAKFVTKCTPINEIHYK
ncbi:MAG: hypothetical protein E7167_00390 [Firmicutes bacterium]|nr:hypothetical protein [Bacillota bacterium]